MCVLRSLFSVYISEIYFAVLSYLSFCCDFSEILLLLKCNCISTVYSVVLIITILIFFYNPLRNRKQA